MYPQRPRGVNAKTEQVRVDFCREVASAVRAGDIAETIGHMPLVITSSDEWRTIDLERVAQRLRSQCQRTSLCPHRKRSRAYNSHARGVPRDHLQALPEGPRSTHSDRRGDRSVRADGDGHAASDSRPQGLTTRQGNEISLTADGLAQSLDVVRRHRIAERFLVDALGLDLDEAHEDACLLEHALSRRVLEALELFLDSPRSARTGIRYPALTAAS